jgi:hypothetical protein
MHRILVSLVLFALLAAVPASADTSSLVPLDVSPKTITIDSLYNGMDLTVTGHVPAGSQVVVRLVGEPTTMHMKEKGKVLGLLWMNLDKVAFAGAPKVFLVAASHETPGEAIAKLGVSGLANQITVTSADADKSKLVAEFLKYQTAEKLYKENAGEVAITPDTGDTRNFTAVMHVPSRLSPGAYTVEAIAVRDGSVIGQGALTIEASFIGAPAFLADMAFGHGALYGILASIIAIAGGLIISQIFRGAKGGAH